ncbi:hypothetical protein HYC85_019475 [Camellia sinensis]|uniref:Uncharacterized protein n=1 Tax=Camellia sinensis TaxID=4442 RepID=A0A7J7GLX3_CAMSI|nr:hypothetical protein HYC85_019475 [Camellia sinensis]
MIKDCGEVFQPSQSCNASALRLIIEAMRQRCSSYLPEWTRPGKENPNSQQTSSQFDFHALQHREKKQK